MHIRQHCFNHGALFYLNILKISIFATLYSLVIFLHFPTNYSAKRVIGLGWGPISHLHTRFCKPSGACLASLSNVCWPLHTLVNFVKLIFVVLLTCGKFKLCFHHISAFVLLSQMLAAQESNSGSVELSEYNFNVSIKENVCVKSEWQWLCCL